MEREIPERRQGPLGVMVRVRDLLEIMADVLAVVVFASMLLPPELSRALLISIEEQQQPEPSAIVALLIGEHLVLLYIKWWHYRVASLLYVKHCMASECPCILYPYCQLYREKRKHLQSCGEMDCQLFECAALKALLLHYENCADQYNCPLCHEVNLDLEALELDVDVEENSKEG